MLIIGNNRASTLATTLEAASNFLLSRDVAKDIIARQISSIRDNWREVCGEAALTGVESRLLDECIFLNECIFKGTENVPW